MMMMMTATTSTEDGRLDHNLMRIQRSNIQGYLSKKGAGFLVMSNLSTELVLKEKHRRILCQNSRGFLEQELTVERLE
jgi:hypothetical protein